MNQKIIRMLFYLKLKYLGVRFKYSIVNITNENNNI